MRDLDILQLGSYYLVHVVFQTVTVLGKSKNVIAREAHYPDQIVTPTVRVGEDIPSPEWSTQRWTYKVPNGIELLPGDQIVVPAQETHRFKVAMVREVGRVGAIPDGIVCRWIVCKVSEGDYWRQQQADTEALRLLKDVRDARRAKELQKELVEALGDDASRIKQIACGSVAVEGAAAE